MMRHIAAERAAPLWRLGEEFTVEGDEPACFTYRGRTRVFERLRCALSRRHQLDNAACALALLEASGEVGARSMSPRCEQGCNLLHGKGVWN